MRVLTVFFAVIAAGVLALQATGADGPVDYPAGYRDWTHAKSMVIFPDHALADPFAGIHHVYANDEALAGLRGGGYARGAVLVFDLLEYNESDGALTEGDRKFIGVMEYDDERFADTGGWGFEVFAGDSRTERVVDDGGRSCFGCHQARKAQDYVFTEYRR